MNNIFAFGDSIMKGIVASPSQLDEGIVKYVISSQGFVNRVGETGGQIIRNLSRFGSTIFGGLNNIDRHLREIKAGDRVVLEFGGNDCNFDWKAIAADPLGVHKPQVGESQCQWKVPKARCSTCGLMLLSATSATPRNCVMLTPSNSALGNSGGKTTALA